jgi:hypothetical protein
VLREFKVSAFAGGRVAQIRNEKTEHLFCQQGPKKTRGPAHFYVAAAETAALRHLGNTPRSYGATSKV